MYEVRCHQVDRRRIDQALTGIEGRIHARWHMMRKDPEIDPEAFAETCDELLDHVAACARFDPVLSGPQVRAALLTAAECAAAVMDRRLWPNGDYEVDFPILIPVEGGSAKLTSPATSYSSAEPRIPPVAEWVRSFALCLISSAFEVPWRRGLVLKFDVTSEIHVSAIESAAALAEMDALADYLVDGDEPPLVVKPDRQARTRAALRLDSAGPLTPDQHLLRVLLDDDQHAFEQALADRLSHYRDGIGDDPEPRTLLPLTAIALANLAVLTHGWHLDVRSGYLPEGLLPKPSADGSAPSTPPVDVPSRHSLTGSQQRVLRMMPLNPGPQISTPALAALTDLPASEALAAAETLTEMHLVEVGEPYGWWRVSDVARTLEPADADGHDDALVRLLEHYRAAAVDANHQLRPTTRDRRRMFTGRGDALVWLDIELPNLTAAAQTAADTGHPQITRDIVLALGEYLNLRHRIADTLQLSTLALRVARQVGDQTAQADALDGRGIALRRLQRFDEAITAYTDAAAMYRQAGDRNREGLALSNLGYALREVGRLEEAITTLTEAAAIFRQSGDRRREGLAVNNLAGALHKARRPDEAITAYNDATKILRQTGDRHGEATAWHGLGLALRAAARAEEAAAAIEKAAAAYRDAGDHHWHQRTLALLEQIRAHQHDGR